MLKNAIGFTLKGRYKAIYKKDYEEEFLFFIDLKESIINNIVKTIYFK